MAKKYKIENGINFFEELYKSLDSPDDTNTNTNVNCLISNDILTTNHVELKCGHKFNYIPLYNDIFNHKRKLNNMEGSNGLLKGNQIRCPYCRKKQDEVLPYYEEYGFPKVGGVNWHLNTNEYEYTNQHKCEFVHNNSIICHLTNYATKLETDDKYYCYSHKKHMIKKFKTDALQKAKEEKDKQKKLKEEDKKAKEKEKVELKLKLKEEKMKLKGEPKSKQSKVSALLLVEGDDENVIVCGGCTSIIKTGLKKGKPCGTMVFENGLCMRHHNLKIKKAEM